MSCVIAPTSLSAGAGSLLKPPVKHLSPEAQPGCCRPATLQVSTLREPKVRTQVSVGSRNIHHIKRGGIQQRSATAEKEVHLHIFFYTMFPQSVNVLLLAGLEFIFFHSSWYGVTWICAGSSVDHGDGVCQGLFCLPARPTREWEQLGGDTAGPADPA